MPDYHGRLELTWTNKGLRLLAHEDGRYEWLPSSDYRVSEVRLLHDAGGVGTVHGDERAKDNLLIRGDALNALTSLSRLPEFEREYVGKVKLIYIDPPFNTQQSFLQYDDALEHSVWLTMMRDRLLLAKDLLAPDGSIWVHCDDSEQAYLKVMIDEVFGRQNYIALITVELNPKGRQLDRFFANSNDYLLVYSRDPQRVALRSSSSDEVRLEDFPLTELDGRKFRLLPLRNTNKKFDPRTRPNLYYPLYVNKATGMVFPDPQSGYERVDPVFGDQSPAVWRWSTPLVRQRKDELLGRIVDGRLGSRLDIFQKDYYTEERTKKLRTVWLNPSMLMLQS